MATLSKNVGSCFERSTPHSNISPNAEMISTCQIKPKMAIPAAMRAKAIGVITVITST